MLTLGYAHLLGAWLAGGRLAVFTGGPARLAAAASLPLLLHVHGSLADGWPPYLAWLLAISTWHACENECALAAARSDRPGPIRADWRGQCIPILATVAVLVVAAGSLPTSERLLFERAGLRLPDLAALGIHFADVFATTTLFHLLSWLEVGIRRRPRLVARVHLAGGLASAASLALPGGVGAELRAIVFSPGLYLFWSALHVAQTAYARQAATRG